MYLRAGYYGQTAGGGGGDGVPDGGETVPGWQHDGVTRTVNNTTNPPTVTLTESTANAAHGINDLALQGSLGPILNAKIYLRAGTRRYVGISINADAGGHGGNFVIDTQTWTIAAQAASGAGANIISASLTDAGNGDWLFETTINCVNAGVSYSALYGQIDTVPVYKPSYLGDGSTLVLRRLDLVTAAAPAPALGAGTVTVAATTGTTLTGTTQHTPAAGVTACVIRYVCRNTVTTSHNPITATFQGKAVVFPAGSQASNISAASKCFVGIGYVLGVTPSTAGSLAITCNRSLGQLVARIDDLPNLAAGNIGAAAATSSVTSSASPAISATMQAAGSIVLAVAGAINGSADPFSLSAGWTEQAEGQSGTAATDAAVVFGTKTGGAVSTVETMTATGAIATTAWGGAILEIKV
jgi:hypothetical protein